MKLQKQMENFDGILNFGNDWLQPTNQLHSLNRMIRKTNKFDFLLIKNLHISNWSVISVVKIRFWSKKYENSSRKIANWVRNQTFSMQTMNEIEIIHLIIPFQWILIHYLKRIQMHFAYAFNLPK